jgi:hypothetical protein
MGVLITELLHHESFFRNRFDLPGNRRQDHAQKTTQRA